MKICERTRAKMSRQYNSAIKILLYFAVFIFSFFLFSFIGVTFILRARLRTQSILMRPMTQWPESPCGYHMVHTDTKPFIHLAAMVAAAAAAATTVMAMSAAAAAVCSTRILIKCKFLFVSYFFKNKFMVIVVANRCWVADVVRSKHRNCMLWQWNQHRCDDDDECQSSKIEWIVWFFWQIAFILWTKMVKCQPQGEMSADLMSDSTSRSA